MRYPLPLLLTRVKNRPLDAILGLRELLDAHWQIIDGSLAILINATVRMIPDEVRKSFTLSRRFIHVIFSTGCECA